MSFVPLCVHSNFSLLSGTRTVEELVGAAAGAGMNAMALTDTNGMYAVVPFLRACRHLGVRPIYGVEIEGEWGDHNPGVDGSHPGCSDGRPVRFTLLARNRRGYGEICRVVTRRHLSDDFSVRGELKRLSEDVYLLSSDRRVLETAGVRRMACVPLPTAVGREWDRVRWRLRRMASQLGISTVAAGRIFFLEPREYFVHRVLTAIRTRTTVGTIPPGELACREDFMPAPGVVERVFRDDLRSLKNTLAVAGDCRVELELSVPRLPRFPVPGGGKPAAFLRWLGVRGLSNRMAGNDLDYERSGSGVVPAFSRSGFYGGGDEKKSAPPQGVSRTEWERALRTLEKELSVICGKGLEDYFLICWDIVRFARHQGMPSLGRGSAGNSLLSYALGITHINPLRCDLYFERFLNPQREQLPDFDIDFATEDREKVLKYIFDRYGRDRVAMICTFSTLRARAALRETAKALGIPAGEIDSVIKKIPFYASVRHLRKLQDISPLISDLPLEHEPMRTLLSLAERISGFPRHIATHPCGLVISPSPITDLIPLQRGERDCEITQWSMYEVEEAGLVKIDIIGQKGLAVIGEAAAMAEHNTGCPIRPDEADYLDDPATAGMMREGRTVGCFYIESPVMMQLLKQAGCDNLEVLTALSSIIRPGVSSYGGKGIYLRRHLGLEPVESTCPAVDKVLGSSYGCLIYQEQVIRLAVEVAGMSYAEADGLRRCMSYKNPPSETMESYRASFMWGALRRGVPEGLAGEIFDRISSFAGYAFCKAHSASFAMESFQSVYWKAHYPAEFMAAVLSNRGGYYTADEYLEEARRLGLEILSPCVNRSRWRYRGCGKRLRVGLMQVKGLSRATAGVIVAGRPYRSLGDFLRRTGAGTGETEALIRCGAMEDMGYSRPELLWQLRVLRGRGGGKSDPAGVTTVPAGSSLYRENSVLERGSSYPKRGSVPERESGLLQRKSLAGCGAGVLDEEKRRILSRIPGLTEYPLSTRVALEMEVLGLAVSDHPLAIWESGRGGRGCLCSGLGRGRGDRRICASELGKHRGEEVELVGWKVTAKVARTAGEGKEMIFVTFSDRTGRYEVIFFPRVYRKVARELGGGRGPFVIRGRVECEFGAESLIANDAKLLAGG